MIVNFDGRHEPPDDLDDLPFANPDSQPNLGAAPRRKCRRHDWQPYSLDIYGNSEWACSRCETVRDETRARRGRNNRKRGNGAELTAARSIPGARKMGPLGLPWDVEMPGYARIQVRKYATPQGLRKIAAELARIAKAPGAEMPGYIWIEPGRGGERLIVFRLADFAERHGIPEVEP